MPSQGIAEQVRTSVTGMPGQHSFLDARSAYLGQMPDLHSWLLGQDEMDILCLFVASLACIIAWWVGAASCKVMRPTLCCNCTTVISVGAWQVVIAADWAPRGLEPG